MSRLVCRCQLSHSLDFLATNRELIEWYGEEFPLEMNPFMLSKSLVDKAEDMGLSLVRPRGRSTFSLHAAVRDAFWSLLLSATRSSLFRPPESTDEILSVVCGRS